MKKKINITFGIPVYNSEKYIDDLFKCFKQSKNINYEIILVDDGSNDESFKLCQNFKKTNPNLNIMVYTKKNEGVSSARNFIIKKANGEWITFVDSDDTINFYEYMNMLNNLQLKDFDFCINIDSKNMYDKLINRSNKLPFLLENQIINSPIGRLFNRKILLDNNILFNENYSLGEDLLFNLNYYLSCHKIIYCNYHIYNIRTVNSNSLTHIYRCNKFNELFSVNAECFNVCKDCSDDVLKALEYLKVKGYFSCVKDEIRFNKCKIYSYIKKMKMQTKSNFLFLNNIKTTFIHFVWFYMPSFVVVFIVRIRNKIKK